VQLRGLFHSALPFIFPLPTRSRVLLQNRIVAQLINKCVSLYGNPKVRYGIGGNQPHASIVKSVQLRLENAEPSVRYHLKQSGNSGGQDGRGAGFLQIIPFSLPIFIPPDARPSSIVRVWHDGSYSGLHAK
jgi:hypothetical protein